MPLTSLAFPAHIALLGNPNCGKTALFNLLTGSRQKVANYAGVTVERKEGTLRTAGGRRVKVLDLPGAYSLNALSNDEAVTRDVITGHSAEAVPDLLVCVTDATNLRLHLRMVLEARQLGLPMVVALNKMDRAKKLGIRIDVERLAQELGVPVIATVSIHANGAQELLTALDKPLARRTASTWAALASAALRSRASLSARSSAVKVGGCTNFSEPSRFRTRCSLAEQSGMGRSAVRRRPLSSKQV